VSIDITPILSVAFRVPGKAKRLVPEHGIKADLEGSVINLEFIFRAGSHYCCYEWGCNTGLFSSKRWERLRQLFSAFGLDSPSRFELHANILIEPGALFFDWGKPDPDRSGWYAFAPSPAYRFEKIVFEACESMWTYSSQKIMNGKAIRVSIDLKGSPVSYSEVLSLWQESSDFRTTFIQTLANSGFAAFRWETPPITKATANRPFEFVMLNCPELKGSPDVEAFAEHFRGVPQGGVVEFSNLGKDAILVVPCPSEPLWAYIHIGTFTRSAPEAQKHALWQLVGGSMQRRLSNIPVWLSTAGAGVAWLHVRLDDRPKYYAYEPYKELGHASN
jgi:hypothetical protein